MSFTRDSLAWSQERGERRRLAVIASIICPLFLVAAVVVTWTQLPEKKREEQEALPPQLARLVLEKKEPPKPVIEKKEEKKSEPEELKPEPKVVEKPKPVPPKPKPEPEVAKKPEPTPADIEKAREKVKKTGILAMSNELSRLSALADTVQLDTPKTVIAEPIARKQTDALAARVSATTRSAGVDESQLNQETREVSLAQRAETRVREAEAVAAAVEAEQQTAQRNHAQRTKEEVRRTIDANKSAIYSIYSRALRKQPSLRGRITPELVIEQSGAVSSCSVVESTLNEPSLEQKICNRLRLVNFGSQPGVTQTTIRYPIELLPG
ncbi:AgmX/PglI C-terminal domain-containing protein [Marinobacter sp.]|uniref:AgmX/PglI C-terminal domain-containing protein n=1 Tax=Marinobacter sp. TaxID=50741 RepID=UPI00384EB226